MKASALVVASFFVLAGCGSTPQPKPDLPEGHYKRLAIHWVGSMACLNQGHLDSRMAVAVQDRVKNALSTWTFDQPKMEAAVRTELSIDPKPTAGFCNQLAVYGQQYLNEVEQQRARNNRSGSGGGYSPSFTTCNRVGAQTFCQSW